jgi:hypothetical protein
MKGTVTIMHIIRAIPGSKQTLSDNLEVQILIDRSLVLEVGKAVLVLLPADEVIALRRYLASHAKKFPIDGVGGGR